MRYALVVCVAAFSVALSSQDAEPRFEVASVKPSDPADKFTRYGVRLDGVSLGNLPLHEIVSLAYDIPRGSRRWRLIGGDETLLAASFTINAKSSGPATPAELRAMLRALLADRFSLRIRPEVREIPVLALTRVRTDRLGRSLEPSSVTCNPFRTDSIAALSAIATSKQTGIANCPTERPLSTSGVFVNSGIGPMSALATSLAGMLASPVIDATGLEATFHWKLEYQFAGPDNGDRRAPLLEDALVEQLGLKLERRNADVEVMVIDRLEQPTPD